MNIRNSDGLKQKVDGVIRQCAGYDLVLTKVSRTRMNHEPVF